MKNLTCHQEGADSFEHPTADSNRKLPKGK